MDASFSHQSTLFSPSSTFRPNLMRKELLFSAVSNKAEQETARNPNSFTQVRAAHLLTMHDALTICVQVRVTESEFDLAYRYANVWRMLTLADRVPKPYLFAVTRSARGAQASEEAGRHDRSDGQLFIEWRDLHSDTSPSSPSSSAAAGIPRSRTYTPSLPPSLPPILRLSHHAFNCSRHGAAGGHRGLLCAGRACPGVSARRVHQVTRSP